MSYSLESDGNALPYTDAHGGKRAPLAPELEFEGSRAGDAGPGHTEGMTEGDGAAVRVHVLCILRNAELVQNRDALTGKRLVVPSQTVQ